MSAVGKGLNREFGIVLLAAWGMFIVKLIFSYYVYGTNDITSWIVFSLIIEKYGTFKIYAWNSLYNHPPLMSWILKLVLWLCYKTKLSFSFLFRLMPIIADFLSVLVIWKILEKRKVRNRLLVCLICVLNPVNFLISGFHGNTDPVFILFLLIAFYFIENDRFALAGLFYGLSLSIKIVPVFFIPVFLYYIALNKQRLVFFSSAFLVLFIFYIPCLLFDYHSFVRNIFYYNSFNGKIWGIAHLMNCGLRNGGINDQMKGGLTAGFNWYINNFKILYLFIELLFLRLLTRYSKLNLIELSFLVFSLFLILTPGFGVQYLSWLSYFSIIILPVLGTIYVLIGGYSAYELYNYLGAGKAPFYANFWIIPSKPDGFEIGLFLFLWLWVIILFVKFIVDRTYDHCKNN